MYKVFFNKNLPSIDFNIISSGIQYKDINHRYGPVIFDHYILQYISSGKGTYVIDNRQFSLNAGDLFVIFPSVVCAYYAESTDPYYYNCLSFSGINAEKLVKTAGFTIQNPVKNINDPQIAQKMDVIFDSLAAQSESNTLLAIKTAYEVMYILTSKIEENNQVHKENTNEYIQKAISFIHHNYNSDITIKQISKVLSLNTNYFSTIFKKNTGVSPIQYLTNYRINKSCYYLTYTNYNITQIADLVGFSDSVSFSIRFKEYKKISPKFYRKQSQLKLL